MLTSAAKVCKYVLTTATCLPLLSPVQFEEMLRNADDADGIHRQAKACATIVYFSSRMEAVRAPSPWYLLGHADLEQICAGMEGGELHRG